MTVSIMNNCEYCIHSHTHFARQKGLTDEQYNEVLEVMGGARNPDGKGKVSTYYRIQASGKVSNHDLPRGIEAVVMRQGSRGKMKYIVVYWRDNFIVKEKEKEQENASEST